MRASLFDIPVAEIQLNIYNLWPSYELHKNRLFFWGKDGRHSTRLHGSMDGNHEAGQRQRSGTRTQQFHIKI